MLNITQMVYIIFSKDIIAFLKMRKLRPSNDKYHIIICNTAKLWSNSRIFLLYLSTISIHIKSFSLHVNEFSFCLSSLTTFIHITHTSNSMAHPCLGNLSRLWFLSVAEWTNAIEWEMTLKGNSNLRKLRKNLGRDF